MRGFSYFSVNLHYSAVMSIHVCVCVCPLVGEQHSYRFTVRQGRMHIIGNEILILFSACWRKKIKQLMLRKFCKFFAPIKFVCPSTVKEKPALSGNILYRRFGWLRYEDILSTGSNFPTVICKIR